MRDHAEARIGASRLLMAVWVVFIMQAAAVQASTWNIGDVFVGVFPGQYNVYDNSGVFKETILTGMSGFTTGCAFNPGKTALYGTDFDSRVVVFDVTHPHTVIQTISDSGIESVVFTSGGDFFTGGPGKQIKKYDSAGVLQQTYSQSAGSDWVDVSSDQHTLFYDEEGTAIHRLDSTGTGTQLTNFSTAEGNAFALRLLPPGDGSAGLLVANGSNVLRLDSSGAIVQTYTASGVGLFFALNLDPNGTSFWTADLSTGRFYRFNIASGAIEVGPISTGAEAAGLCVLGEPTGAVGGGGGCGHHTVHGHLVTSPPDGHNGVVSGVHHGQHGHTVAAGSTCPPHAPGHTPGLTAETAAEGLFGGGSQEPTFVAGLNQDGTLNGNPLVVKVPGARVLPALRGSVVQLFGSATGLFLDAQDLRGAGGFMPPASGSPLFYTSSLPDVRIGGVAAKVLFSGLAPGLTGVWQINVQIPAGLAVGSVPVTVTYEGDELTSVNLAIQ